MPPLRKHCVLTFATTTGTSKMVFFFSTDPVRMKIVFLESLTMPTLVLLLSVLRSPDYYFLALFE